MANRGESGNVWCDRANEHDESVNDKLIKMWLFEELLDLC
jgi:hypothetical protein